MFVWARIKNVKDTLKMCMEHGFEEGIVVLPGSACAHDPDAPSSHVRLSYSLVSPEAMEKVKPSSYYISSLNRFGWLEYFFLSSLLAR
jgi:DNA-binding transcriptional MocR family regulator